MDSAKPMRPSTARRANSCCARRRAIWVQPACIGFRLTAKYDGPRSELISCASLNSLRSSDVNRSSVISPRFRLRLTAPARTLGFADLFFYAASVALSIRWISVAAAAGPASLWIWAVAVLVFSGPLIVATAELTGRFPGEGGVYTWTGEAFGPFWGFLCGWLYWVSNLPFFSGVLVFMLNLLALALGPAGKPMLTSRGCSPRRRALSVAVGALHYFGLGTGKWLSNIGGASNFVLVGLLADRDRRRPEAGLGDRFRPFQLSPAAGRQRRDPLGDDGVRGRRIGGAGVHAQRRARRHADHPRRVGHGRRGADRVLLRRHRLDPGDPVAAGRDAAFRPAGRAGPGAEDARPGSVRRWCCSPPSSARWAPTAPGSASARGCRLRPGSTPTCRRRSAGATRAPGRRWCRSRCRQ